MLNPNPKRREQPAKRDDLATLIATQLKSNESTDQKERRSRWLEYQQTRMRRRLRQQLRPHYALGGLLLAAGTAELVTMAGADPGLVSGAVATLAFSTAGITGARLYRRLPADRRRWANWCLTGSASWLSLASATGLSWDLVAALLLGGYASALPHWRRHRIVNPTSVPLGPAEIETSVPARWEENLAAAGRRFAKSYLTAREDTRYGEKYTVQLVPGVQTSNMLLAEMNLIASGLQVPLKNLIAEKHPSGDPSRGMVQVLTRPSPIDQEVLFDGPAYRYDPVSGEGLIGLGPYADGESEANWRLYTENSMWGGVIIGGTGSGKSRQAESIAISAMASGHTTLIYGDPQYGASSKFLTEAADYTALGAEAIYQTLLGLARGGGVRQLENAALGLDGFTPSPERPGVLFIIDEAHKVFRPGEHEDAALATQVADNIAREFRKLGITLILLSQYPGIETFGNKESLRAALMAGNATVLRTTSKTTKGIMAGLDFDPADLPDLPGYGVRIDPSATGRTAPYRGRYLKRPEDFPIRGVSLDALMANAWGEEYTQRHERRAAEQAALQRQLEALRAGIPAQRATAPVVVSGLMSAPQQPAEGDLPQVVEFPIFSTEGGDPPVITAAQARFLGALRAGNTSPAAIQRATGFSESYVRRIRDELLVTGRIVKTGTGRYVLTEQVSSEAAG